MSESVKTALMANGAIAAAKTVGAIFTGSASMAAEAVHSFADCGNQLLLMLGMRNSKREANADHPLGYGKDTYFWSFIVALLLFSLGGLFSLHEGIDKLHNPEPLKYVGWAVAILLFGFFVELKSFRVCLAEIRQKYPGKSILWFLKETRSPELLVIFGEDLAALTGLGIVATFLGIAFITGNPVWDAVGSIAVGVLLIGVAVGLFWEIKALLIGQSVDPAVRKALREHIHERDEIEHTYNLVTMQMGVEAVLMLRCRMTEKEDAQKLLADINAVEKSIFEAFPQFTHIYLEPDNQVEDF